MNVIIPKDNVPGLSWGEARVFPRPAARKAPSPAVEVLHAQRRHCKQESVFRTCFSSYSPPFLPLLLSLFHCCKFTKLFSFIQATDGQKKATKLNP